MPWNGTGTFTRNYSWVNDAAAGINITASRMDADTNDIVNNGLGNCLTRDGQGVANTNIPMAGYIHTNVGSSTARNQYATVGQLQDDDYLFAVAGGTTDAITASFSPAFTAIIDGCQVYVRASGSNVTTAPTFSPDGLTAWVITKGGGQALAAGDIAGLNYEIVLRANVAAQVWELLNPGPQTITNSVASGNTGQVSFTANGVIYGNGTSPLLQVALNATSTKKYLQQVSSGVPSYQQVAAADLSDGVTGSGNIVLKTAAALTSPVLTTPVLGVATATTINKVTITTPSTGATLTINNGFTLTVTANATVSGTNTGDQTITLSGAVSGSGTGSIVTTLATVAVASGGTGSTTASGARTNLGLAYATSAQVKAETSGVVQSPDTLIYSQYTSKGWIRFSPGNPPTNKVASSSISTASLSRVSAGHYTVTAPTVVNASDNSCYPVGSADQSAASFVVGTDAAVAASATTDIYIRNAGTGSLSDGPAIVMVVFF